MDQKTVRKVARLGRLALSDAQLDRMGTQITGIMKWIDQLAEVNTDNVEPLANVANIELKLRTDEVTDGGNAQNVLSNAPEEMQGFYVVPKVVE